MRENSLPNKVIELECSIKWENYKKWIKLKYWFLQIILQLAANSRAVGTSGNRFCYREKFQILQSGLVEKEYYHWEWLFCQGDTAKNELYVCLNLKKQYANSIAVLQNH